VTASAGRMGLLDVARAKRVSATSQLPGSLLATTAARRCPPGLVACWSARHCMADRSAPSRRSRKVTRRTSPHRTTQWKGCPPAPLALGRRPATACKCDALEMAAAPWPQAATATALLALPPALPAMPPAQYPQDAGARVLWPRPRQPKPRRQAAPPSPAHRRRARRPAGSTPAALGFSSARTTSRARISARLASPRGGRRRPQGMPLCSRARPHDRRRAEP